MKTALVIVSLLLCVSLTIIIKEKLLLPPISKAALIEVPGCNQTSIEVQDLEQRIFAYKDGILQNGLRVARTIEEKSSAEEIGKYITELRADSVAEYSQMIKSVSDVIAKFTERQTSDITAITKSRATEEAKLEKIKDVEVQYEKFRGRAVTCLDIIKKGYDSMDSAAQTVIEQLKIYQQQQK